MKQIGRWVFGIAVAALPLAGMAGSQPNILVIHIDDMDFDEIGAYEGQGKVWTPNLDSLIAGGMKFNRGYVTSAVCVPSRFATMTGRYSSRCRELAENTPATETLNLENVWSASTRESTKNPPTIGEDEYTFAKLLKTAGYTTALVGKIHNDHERLQRPVQGEIEGDPRDPAVAKQIREQYEAIVARVQRNYGFDVVDRLYYDNKEQFACPEELRTLNSPWITEGAIRFLEQVDASKPFLLYYSNPVPHGQMVGPVRNKNAAATKALGRHVEMNAIGDRLLATPSGYLEKAPDIQPATADMLERFWKNVPEGNPDAAMMTWLDDSVGALLATLRKRGLAENTLVFFISDHQSVDKFTGFARGAHVPMAVAWPGKIKPGAVSESLVSSLDFTATMVDVAGVKVPDDCILDGFSMRPLFANPQAVIRDSVMIELGYARGVVADDWQYLALRFPAGMEPTADQPQLHAGGDRKGKAQSLVENHPGGMDRDQLYNLARDPTQKTNEWNNPEYRAIGEKLQRQLTGYLVQFPHAYGEFKK